MAAYDQRKLLAQLMGEQAMSNHPAAIKMQITDPKACHSYIVGKCPHDLFTNTKQDLGPCPKVHSDALKAEWEAASDQQKRDWGFEFTYVNEMQKQVAECDRRIDTAQRRLEKTPDEIRQTNQLLRQINELNKTIENGMLEVEMLGELGQVNRAVMEFFTIRQKKQEKEDRERDLKSLSETGGPSGHQKLQVCDVCGAYLSRLDNDRRLADHFYGKMHLGFAEMRKAYNQLKVELQGRRPPMRQGFDRPRNDYDSNGHRGGGGWGRGGGGGGGGGGGMRGGGRGRPRRGGW